MKELTKYSFVCDTCGRDEVIPPTKRHWYSGDLCNGTFKKVQWKGEFVE